MTFAPERNPAAHSVIFFLRFKFSASSFTSSGQSVVSTSGRARFASPPWIQRCDAGASRPCMSYPFPLVSGEASQPHRGRAGLVSGGLWLFRIPSGHSVCPG